MSSFILAKMRPPPQCGISFPAIRPYLQTRIEILTHPTSEAVEGQNTTPRRRAVGSLACFRRPVCRCPDRCAGNGLACPCDKNAPSDDGQANRCRLQRIRDGHNGRRRGAPRAPASTALSTAVKSRGWRSPQLHLCYRHSRRSDRPADRQPKQPTAIKPTTFPSDRSGRRQPRFGMRSQVAPNVRVVQE